MFVEEAANSYNKKTTDTKEKAANFTRLIKKVNNEG